jgi:Rap1a immunity proteins
MRGDMPVETPLDTRVVGVVLGLAWVLLVADVPCAAPTLPAIRGYELLEDCTNYVRMADSPETLPLSQSQVMGAGFCAGLAQGILTMELVVQGSGVPHVFCPPPHLQIHQGVRVIVRFLQDHPERLRDDGQAMIIAAFGQAFRCPPPAPAPRR